jgi:hypothetical protein
LERSINVGLARVFSVASYLKRFRASRHVKGLPFAPSHEDKPSTFTLASVYVVALAFRIAVHG